MIIFNLIVNQKKYMSDNLPVFIQLNFNEFNKFNKKYNLDINEFILLELINFRYKKFNSFNFSNEFLASLLKISSRQISRIISKLAELNLIIVIVDKAPDKNNKIKSSRNILLASDYFNFTNRQKVQTGIIKKTYKNAIKSVKNDKVATGQVGAYIINTIINSDNSIKLDKNSVPEAPELDKKVITENYKKITADIKKKLLENKKKWDY